MDLQSGGEGSIQVAVLRQARVQQLHGVLPPLHTTPTPSGTKEKIVNTVRRYNGSLKTWRQPEAQPITLHEGADSHKHMASKGCLQGATQSLLHLLSLLSDCCAAFRGSVYKDPARSLPYRALQSEAAASTKSA